MLTDYMKLSDEVMNAIQNHQPIVALESTIISHGMPYPVNLNTAAEVEQIIRQAGAIPATIAIINGIIKVGLNQDDLMFMATSKEIYKVSERDLPFIISRKINAATTVSGSLAVASALGIRVFATGGIGAVGPDGNKTLDISADLLAVGKFPCMTICSGAKAFMDISATLEFLETHSVAVVVYQSNIFPLFYSLDSGFKVDWAMKDVKEIAEVYAVFNSINPQKGLLVAVPIPISDAIPESKIHKVIDEAIARVNQLGVTGKEYTPKVLSLIKEITGGQSLDANVALIKNNAKVAAEISVAYSKIAKQQ